MPWKSIVVETGGRGRKGVGAGCIRAEATRFDRMACRLDPGLEDQAGQRRSTVTSAFRKSLIQQNRGERANRPSLWTARSDAAFDERIKEVWGLGDEPTPVDLRKNGLNTPRALSTF